MTTQHEGFEPYQIAELEQLGIRAESEKLARSGVSHEDAFIRMRKAARAAAKAAALALSGGTPEPASASPAAAKAAAPAKAGASGAAKAAS